MSRQDHGATANDNVRSRLRCSGTSRIGDNAKAVLVSFSRPLTDGELRFFHEVCARTAPLMDGES